MSLPNYLDRLREKIAVWMKRHYRLRQRQLKVVRLEDRRLPDASFALVGDALTVEVLDGATDAVDVSFDANTNEFHLELSSGTWLSENPGPLDPAVSLNGNVLTVALPSLSELQIHGSGTPLHVTDSGNAFSVGRLTITGATDVVMDSASDFDSICIEADSLTLNDSDDLEISTLHVADSVDLSVTGSLTNSVSAQIEVGGHASFEGTSIVLGQHVADHVELNSFSVNATESVEIVGDSALELTGSSTAAQLFLSSAESIDVADDATLTVDGNTDLTADEINVRGEFQSGSVTFHSAGHVQIHEASEMTLTGNSSAGSLTLEAVGLLTDTANSLLQVTGHAEMTADEMTLGNGGVEIGSLQFDSAGTVTLLQESEVRLSGDSYAGTLVAENAELIGNGIIHNGIEISDGGVLGGWLNVAGALTIGPNGVLSPGNSPGITTSGNLILAANSTLLIELDDDNSSGHPGAVAGVDYDQTQVTGTVTINSTANLNLQDLGSTQSLTGDVYVIVQNDGVDAVVGTFAGLANGAVVTAVAGGTYSIYYNGGTGNDIVLIRRPAAVTDVYVSNTFVGLSNGAAVTDYDFLTAGNQAGVYGLNAFATIPEAITAVTAGGIIHVDQGTYLHSATLAVNKAVTIDGQGMGLTNILKAGAPTGNFDEAIRITADAVTLSDAKLGWQIHNTTDYQGYVVITTADSTSINRILFGSNATGEGYRSAVVFEGSGVNGADGLEVSDSIFEGRWGRAAIRDGDAGSGQNFLITRNEFREDHFRWGPIAIGPQDSAGTPNNFAFSGEISFNYFGNGLDALDFQSLGNQNYTVTITNQGLTATGLDIVHNTFDWNDSTETNVNGVYAQPAGVYITPSLTLNTNQILIQDNIFNNFAYAGPQPGTTDPLWRPTGGVFGGALEFDGADDFGVWQSSLFDVGTAGTLNFWVQMHDTSRRNQFFEGPGNAGLEMQYRNTSGGQVYGRTTTVGGDNVIRSGPDGATLLNTWHNIQYTWDFNATNATGRMRIYIDGVESGYLATFTPNDLTWASAVSTINGLMNIGRDPGDTTRYFDGLMDDVGWFNSVLDSTDRTNIRTNGVSALASDARLVSHWDFNQSSGDIAVDNKNGIQLYLSTTGVVPTEFGAVFRPGQGQFGGALEFDGVDDFATFRDSSFDVGEHGTLNFWIRMHDTSRRNQFFEGPDNAGMEFQYRNNSSGQLYSRTTTAGGDFVIRSGPDGATLLNSWHNIQYTWDFNATNAVGKMRIYVDGVESGYLAGSTPNDLTWTAITDTVSGLMNVGRDPGDLTRFFDGLMDDIAWYDQVLSAGDRNTIRTSGVTAHNDLVAHWNLDDAVGTTQAAGNSGTNITLYINQIAPSPPVSGYGVVTPLAALVLNNVFYNDVTGTYADSNQVLNSSNITGAGANPFFAGDDPHTVFTGTTLAEFYRLRFGSSAAYQSTEFQASIATLIPHVGANQENPVAVGTEDILVAGTDFDDLVVITFTSDNDGSFVFTRNVTGGTPDYVGTFNFIDITSFTFDGYGADDVMIIIQPTATQGGLYSISGGIAFHGELQNSDGNALDSDGVTGGDTLVLLTSASDQATIDSVSYALGNDDPATRHQGTITLINGLLSTTITYTGTEPIRDELIADARTFFFDSTFGGGDEIINVSAVGDTVEMTAVVPFRPAVSIRTLNNRVVSSLGPNISFANPRTHLTLNAGIGNDTINVNSLHTDYRAALSINGDGGTDAVNLNSSLTLGNTVNGNTGNLTVTAETVTVANGVAINTTAESSGDGDIRFTSTGAVNIGSGASLTTNSGFVIVTTVDGDIDVDGTISTGSDNILLMANGTGRDVEVTADVSSSSGHLSVMADDSVRLLANVDLQVGNAGTLIIEAANGAITMDAATSLVSANGGIRLLAVNDITLGDVTASNSHVSINSSAGSILDAESSDSEADIVALGLRLQAALGIGTLGGSSNPIETTVSTLSARAGSGGINVLESNGLTVDDVTVTTQKVQTNNSLTATTDAVQSDLVTTNAGSIVLRSTNGTMTLNDGTGNANGISVSANGAGNVLLQTISGPADIVVNANVETGIGHVSLFSSDDIDLNANIAAGGSGTVHLAAGNIGNDALTGIDMQNGTSITTAGGNVRLTADRESDVLLGLINAGRGNVSILAERSVLDSNVAALNIQANSARIVADAALSNASNQVGVIGGSETGNPDPNGNNNAIDIQVTTLAAQSATGIYVKEADGLSVDATPQIVVQSVNADASLTAQTDNTLSDLVSTNNGPIKLQTTVGSLTLNDGDADSLAVSANGSGDVLLQTLGSSGDVLISSSISGVAGNITVNSADDIVVNGAITTGGTGTIYLVATNGATDAIGSQVDGITLNFGLTSSSGDVLLSSQNDLQQSALISSTSGDIGIIATRNIDQAVNGDVTTTSGDVLVQATAGNWTMDADATITAGGGDVLGTAGTNIALGVISTTNGTANRIALNAVAGSITDANAASINVEETVAAATTSLSLRAGTIIGGASGTTSAVNNQALDIDVDTVAATAATGIYLREVAAGGAIAVDNASAVTVNINGVVRADFRSSTTSAAETRTMASLEDLTTSNNGPIKLVAENGAITINGGNDVAGVSAHGTGDVLLEARGTSSDLTVNATVSSDSRHITLDADRSIDLNAAVTVDSGSGTVYVLSGADVDVDAQVSSANGDILFEAGDEFRQSALIRSTGGDIGFIAANSITQAVNGDVTTTSGDVLVQATAGNWTMDGGATITAGGGDVLGTAGTNIALGVISTTNGTANRIALNAVAGSITDANAASINVEETVAAATTSLTLRAGTIIGGAGGTTSAVNNQALDLDVDTVAANAATGIYLREVAAGGAITVDSASAVTVNINSVVRADFDSSTTSVAETRTVASLEDLTSTTNGPIKLVAENGTITINGGNDTSGLSANGTGDILLEARGNNSDLIVNDTVTSGSGHLTLSADRSIDINAAVTVSSGSGTVYVLSGTDTNVDAQVSSVNGDVLFEAGDEIRQAALVRSTGGDIGIIAANSITQAVNGDVTTTSGDVLVQATAGNWTMDGGATITAGGGDVLGTAGTNIALGVISTTNGTANRIALNAVAGSITDANAASINVEETVAAATTSLTLRAGTIIGGAGGTTSAVNNQALDLDVDTVAANAATGIYLREVAAGGAITVDSASAVTVNINSVVRADFDSSTTSVAETRTVASLEDLTSTTNGPIKLVAENGTITINGGNDTSGLSANGTGDILLEARGNNSDLIVNDTVTSGSGHLTLSADRSIDINAAVTVSSGSGTVYVLSGTDTDVDAQVSSANGDILFEAGDEFRQTALVRSTGGDIGIIASSSITQAVSGDVTTTSGDVLVDAGTAWAMNGGATITAGGGDVLGTAGNNITLGVISVTNAASNRIALNAVAGSITDANVASINVEETVAAATTSLTLRAGTIISGAGGTTSAVNNQALDLDVDTVAANAVTGIYLREVAAGGAITVNLASAVTVNINGVVRADFDSSTTSVAETRTIASLEDLTSTTNGPIKLVAENGTITIDGGANSVAINANGTGDILLEARGNNSDLFVEGTVTSGSGHITLDADRSIDINAAVTVSSGNGTVYVLSGVDIDVDAQVSSANGDILFEAGDEFRQSALIRSTGGDIGFIAANSITQAVNGDVTTTSGDVLVQATAGNWTMDADATITAGGGDVLGTAGTNIALGVISTTNGTANRIALNAVAGSITDANAASINVEETVAAATTSLTLRAGTIIGGAGGTTSAVNNQALDLDVDTVAANAATGIYLREVAAGGAIIVDSASAVTVNINGVVRADFDSSTASVAETRTISSLEDLTSTNNGPIKLVAENGTITIDGGANSVAINANGTGDVLLEARGNNSDLFIEGTVTSGSGHITLDADRSIDINAAVTVSSGSGTVYVLSGADVDVDAQVSSANGDILFEAGDEFRQSALIRSTGGDIGFIAANSITQAVNGDVTTTSGDVLVQATAGNWMMDGGATITAGGGDVLGTAGNNITLGVISATNVASNRIALNAVAGSITDANAASINVEETVAAATTSLTLRAGTIIGGAGGTTSAVNNQALDLDVDTVAANAATGIYLREVAAGGAITVDSASAVTVNINGVVRADFDSSTTSVAETRTVASLEDLTSTTNGPIKLVAENGTLTINGGADSTAINAGGTGDILLEARGAGRDVIVNASTESGSGHVTLNATDDVELNASLSTGGAGTIYIQGAGVSINGTIDSVNGDVLISSTQEIIQNAGISSNSGDVGLITNLSVTQASIGDISTASGDVLIEAGTDWVMSGGTVITAGGGDFDGKALAGEIALGQINSGRTALTAGSDIRDVNGATLNVIGTSISLRAGGLIGNHQSGNGTSQINANAIDTQVTTLAASAGTGIYIEEANSLTIDTVETVSVSVNGPKQANFDSATTDVPESRSTAILEDLTTRNNGPIKIVSLNGSLTINGGDSAASGLTAHGTGDVLLEARGAGSDVTLNADISSNAGDVTVIAADSVFIHRDLTTSGTGTVYVQAQLGSITLTDGDSNSTGIQTTSGGILLQADLNITLNAELESTAADIGVDAGVDLLQNRDITAGADLLLIAGQNITMAGSAVSEADGGELVLNAGDDISLGLVQATNVAIESGDSILDARLNETTNIRATNLRMIAVDEIGAADSVSSADTNLQAIDTEVMNLSTQSAAGIHIQEVAAGGSIIIRDVADITASVSVARANFNSTQDTVARTNTLSGLADLTTTLNGDIKLVARNGSITINDGTTAVTNAANGRGTLAHGSGDVLLEARGAASDVVVNSSLLSGRGHITLNSADQVDVNASVQTGGNGTVYIVAGNDIDLGADVTTASGDILVNAGRDLTQSDLIQSTAGDIGLIAGRNILQSASGDTSTSTGDVLIDAGTNWEMDGDATITVGGGKIVGQTQSGRILLGVIELTNATVNQVALSAGTDLVDANAAAINIYESTALSATSVSFRSGGAIGDADLSNPSPSQNFNALDLNVDVVSASAVTGIYLREVAAGGGISVSRVETVNVSIDGVQRSRFNSSSTNAGQDRTVSALEDLVTNNGPIKVVAENGTFTIGGGIDSQAVSAGGSGDILVEARGAGSDVVVNAAISSGSGHITLNATDDVDLNASLSTGGSGTIYMTGAGISIDGAVTTENGDVLISSTQSMSQTAAINSTTGDVGLIASLAIVQSSSGDITTVAGDVLIEAGTDWTMSNGTIITAGGGDFDGKALTGDVALGRINSERTALTAGSDISDANSATLNVVGTSLSLRAGELIGNSDALNGTPLSNTNAIDTQISTLAAVAGTGIYIEEANSLTIDAVAEVNVSIDEPVRSNFKSTTTDVSLSRTTAMLEDLTTGNSGPIKIVTLNGTITVNGGASAGLAISANGTGDVLLEARGTGSDVIVNSDVMSRTGHVSVVAADSVSIARDIITGGAGRVLVEATSGSITLTDADANITGIRTTSGDILLRAAQNVVLTADLESTSATIGIDAGIDVQQNRNITAGGDVVLVSGQNILMAATAETKADGGEMIFAAGQDISLGLLQATNVSMNAGADLSDARVSESTNIRSTNLRMIAGDAIGGADSISDSGTNLNAIDTEVTNLAARSGTGIHVREVSSGGSVVVKDIASISVDVISGRVNFNSTLTEVLLTQRLSGLSDLTTTRNGDIKLLAENRTITIEDGSNGVPQSSNDVGINADGTGDVLLEARGGGSDIVMNSEVRSGSGHITMNAADDVNLTADVATSGSGTVYLRSQNNSTDGVTGIVMANGTSITTGGGNVRLIANNESDIWLGLINAGTGDVSVNAERSVLDNNGSSLNIQADALRIVADADISGAGSVVSLNGNGVGIIGGPDATNGTPSTNVNALDLQVATLAVQSADGIYLHEMNGLAIQATGTIAVQQANFNSSTTTRTDSSLSDLVTTDNGSIKLLSTEGTITVSDGDGDSVGVVADSSGDVLLQTLNATGDIIVDASVMSTTGHVTLNAADDVDVNASVSTGGAGTVYVNAAGINIDATVTTVNGEILISSTQNMNQTALVTSSSGNIGLIATGTISQFNDGDITTTSGDVLVEAGRDWTMSTGTVIRAGGGDFDGKALSGSIALGQIRSTRSALTAGNDISDANETALNVIGTSVSFRAGDLIGNSDPTNGATLTNLNAIDTQVETLAALAGTGIFIEDADSLTVDSVAAVNVAVAGPTQVNFNSTTTPVPESRGTAILEDLTMTGVGEIRITTVSESITLNRGIASVGDPLRNIAVYAPGGGKVSIQAATDIFVHGNIVTREEGVVSSDPATDAIRLIARSGDIVIGDPSDLSREIVISTDHDEVNGSSDTTNDVVDLIARAGQVGNTSIGGKISILSPVTVRTDGGVAKKFGPRPDVGATSTAFFQYVSNPLPLAIDNSPAAWSTGNAYINAFSVLIGQSGEENLTVDIDWQDPSEEPGVFFSGTTQTIAGNMGIYNQISSERIQQFLVENGGPSTPGLGNTNGQIVVGHLYTALDYTRFQQQQNRTTIIIDLSVSHHSSINLSASSIAQSGVTQRVPGLDAASTDISTTVSDRGFATPDIFENGIASFKIPTVTPAPPALFTSTFVPRVDRPFSVAPPENQAAISGQNTVEFGGGAVGGSVFSTEVYFQIRRQFETDGPAEVVVERITDSSLISSREAFEKFVEQNPELQDGAGYEIWLISETGGQKVERPIVEFEISGGQPGTMHESVPEGSPTQQLKDLPFEQPAESETMPEKQDPEIPQANMDGDADTSEFANQQSISDVNTAALAGSDSTTAEEDASTPASDVLNPSSGAVVGLMVRRFRKRQQESAMSQSTFSRAARFQRKHSSPGSDLQVRGSSDV